MVLDNKASAAVLQAKVEAESKRRRVQLLRQELSNDRNRTLQQTLNSQVEFVKFLNTQRAWSVFSLLCRA